MSNQELNIKIESSLNELHKVEAFIEQICDENSIYNNYFSNILVSVTEAFSNAVLHGNKNSKDKFVVVGFIKDSRGLVFYVEDQGSGFNYQQVSDPTSIDQDSEKGRGLFLIKHLADGVEFIEEGRRVELLFRIASINYESALSRVSLLKEYYNSVTNKAIVH